MHPWTYTYVLYTVTHQADGETKCPLLCYRKGQGKLRVTWNSSTCSRIRARISLTLNRLTFLTCCQRFSTSSVWSGSTATFIKLASDWPVYWERWVGITPIVTAHGVSWIILKDDPLALWAFHCKQDDLILSARLHVQKAKEIGAHRRF